jgi:hypothetical protein
MAIISGNLLAMGLSGSIGDQLVFYTRKGKQLVRKMPEKRRFTSARQIDRQLRFKAAVEKARRAIRQEPELVELVAKTLLPEQSLYHGLVSYYMKHPG